MDTKYIKLTPSMVLDLAAPHTWPASIFPVLLAVCASIAAGYEISICLSMVLLAISVLFQSATNSINDYFDFKKGADTADDNLEESDSVLVYNNVNPKSVLAVSFAFVILAVALGLYCVYVSGPFCLIIAAIGMVSLVLYSGGRLPISYLPIGELVSGFVMGGLITYASYCILTRDISPMILVVSIPLIIDIALIMLTNNISDIEKDEAVGRKTLPVVLGRPGARILYLTLIALSLASIVAICAIFYTASLVLFPFLFLITLPITMRLFKSDFMPGSRIFNMGQICSFNIATGAMYCLMVAASLMHVGI